MDRRGRGRIRGAVLAKLWGSAMVNVGCLDSKVCLQQRPARLQVSMDERSLLYVLP